MLGEVNTRGLHCTGARGHAFYQRKIHATGLLPRCFYLGREGLTLLFLRLIWGCDEYLLRKFSGARIRLPGRSAPCPPPAPAGSAFTCAERPGSLIPDVAWFARLRHRECCSQRQGGAHAAVRSRRSPLERAGDTNGGVCPHPAASPARQGIKKGRTSRPFLD